MKPWLGLLVVAACTSGSRNVPAYLTGDPCSSITDEAACLGNSECEWFALGAPCPLGALCPSGVCTAKDPCAGHGDEASCVADTQNHCAWAAIEGLCPAGHDCAGGFCHTETECVCACPLACPAGADCPPCACDCGGGDDPGGTCRCACPACAPGETCPPCDCDCGPPPDCNDGTTCTCSCPACVPGETCPPCDCDCACTCGCPPCPEGGACEPCYCPCVRGDDRHKVLDPSHPFYGRFEGVGADNDCRGDGDCVVSGCSSEICAAEGVDSTCELVDTSAIAGASCGCVGGECVWFTDGPICPCVCPACIPGESCPPCTCGASL